MWGQVLELRLCHFAAGIIPMRVGTSFNYNFIVGYSRDHPHACGDKLKNGVRLYSDIGSSPCVWGQVDIISATLSPLRIIPMRVGTSDEPLHNDRQSEDHPHACGDKRLLIFRHSQYWGSSPCVWGQGLITAAKPMTPRIIPMRVGTSQID